MRRIRSSINAWSSIGYPARSVTNTARPLTKAW